MQTNVERTALALIALCTSASTGIARPQSFNVDIGDASAMGVPSSNYGAAAGQAGEWNGVPVLQAVTSLSDLNGDPTNVVFRNGSNFAVTWNHAGTVGDDEALLDDLGDPGSSGLYRFDGLLPGGYELWTYAWAPDSAAGLSSVIVTGATEPAATVGGAWSGALAEGITHSVHHLNVTSGTVFIDVVPAAGSSFASVNGFQLVYSGQVASLCLGSGNAPCPCANQAPAGMPGGCVHGAGSWVTLAHVGTTLVSADDLVLYAAGGPPHAQAILLQGASLVQWSFKDGLLCTGNPTRRIEVLQLDFLGGASSSVSIVAEGGVLPGDRRYYQLWYIDAQSLCGNGMNTSNALQVDWL